MEYSAITVGERKVRYFRAGHGKTLLFLHGIAGEPHYYAPLLEALSKRYEVIAPAIYGLTYLSNPPASIAKATALTLEFCAALGIRPAVIAGHSYGGMVALSLPEGSVRDAKIIAINPGPEQTRSIFPLLWRSARKGAPAALGLRGGRGLRHAWPAGMVVLSTLAFHPFFCYHILQDIAGFRYPRRRTDAILLFGDRDEYCDERQASRLRELLPMTTLAGQYHDWPIFNPALAEKEIVDAIEKC